MATAYLVYEPGDGWVCYSDIPDAKILQSLFDAMIQLIVTFPNADKTTKRLAAKAPKPDKPQEGTILVETAVLTPTGDVENKTELQVPIKGKGPGAASKRRFRRRGGALRGGTLRAPYSMNTPAG